jgi:hypothetical protein
MLLDKESHVPRVHHLARSLKVSVAGTIDANYTAYLPFDLPRERK